MPDTDPVDKKATTEFMPFEKSRYPDNWDEISLHIRTQANWICQGCGLPCRRPDEPWTQFCDRRGWNTFDPNHKRGQYVLTVAHLDQNPQNCDRSNLKALCTICHLRYRAHLRSLDIGCKSLEH